MFRRTVTLLCSLAIAPTLVVGCDAEPIEDEDATLRQSIAPENAQRILDLVNDPATDAAFLDHEVQLRSNAAQNIIETRNGFDGVYPSEDDVQFMSLEDLDAVPYVGDFALQTMENWVIANPGPEMELVEGVQFTGAEAQAVIWGVNQASVAELDDEVGLSGTAAQNLFDGGPYDTVTDMGPVSYIGPSALTKLRDHAPVWQAAKADADANSQAGTHDGVDFDHDTAVKALEVANDATHEELTDAAGMWSTGATRMVDNRPYSNLDEVAAVSGIGSATMQALHDYAALLP